MTSTWSDGTPVDTEALEAAWREALRYGGAPTMMIVPGSWMERTYAGGHVRVRRRGRWVVAPRRVWAVKASVLAEMNR